MLAKRIKLVLLLSFLFYAKNTFCTPETIWGDPKGLRIEALNSNDVQEFRNRIATIQTPFFSKYPYFYKSTKADWCQSIEESSGKKKTIYLILFDKKKVVGYSNAFPINRIEIFNTNLKNKGIKTQKLFYIANIIILPEYRGLGLSKHFFACLEKKALEWGFDYTTLISIQRPNNYPGKPENYKSVKDIWKHFGYMKLPFTLHETYIQSDTHKETDNTHDFWIKQLT